MKNITLDHHLFCKFGLTDGKYAEGVSVSKDGDKIHLYVRGEDNRTLFTTDKWRERSCGTLKLEDIEPILKITGKTSHIFQLVPEECEFDYRSGILFYKTIKGDKTLTVEEIHHWDE